MCMSPLNRYINYYAIYRWLFIINNIVFEHSAALVDHLMCVCVCVHIYATSQIIARSGLSDDSTKICEDVFRKYCIYVYQVGFIMNPICGLYIT
jgi:hypothetical protein